MSSSVGFWINSAVAIMLGVVSVVLRTIRFRVQGKKKHQPSMEIHELLVFVQAGGLFLGRMKLHYPPEE